MTVYRPDVRWLVDWANNGYRSSRADVTDRLHTWEVRYGAEASARPDAVVPALARGRLVLDNLDRAFDPDSRKAVLDENVLRAPHKCKLTGNGRTIWEGKVASANRGDLVRGEVTNWELSSTHFNALKNKGTINLGNNSTVAALMEEFRELTGVPISGDVGVQPTGQVYHYGQWLDFLDDFGKYAGGWVIEDETGDQNFRRWAGQHPLVSRFTLANRPLARLSGFAERSSHVRNAISARAFFWLPVLDDEGNPQEVTLASSIAQVASGQSLEVELEFTSRANRRPTRWLRAEARGSGDNIPISASNFRRVDDFNAVATFQAPTYVGGFRQYEILAIGNVEERREVKNLTQTSAEFDTAGVFGERVLQAPPWFPQTFEGLNEFFWPWVRNLSQPPEHVRVGYGLWQRTRSQADAVMFDAQPGNRVTVELPVDDDTNKTFDILILGTKLSGGVQKAPVREFTGVTRRSRPPEPLRAFRASGIADTSVQLGATVAFPRGQSTFFRARTK